MTSETVKSSTLHDSISQELEGKYCNGCLRSFSKKDLLICYVNSSPDDVDEFSSLAQATEYSAKYIPPWEDVDDDI